MINKGIRFLNGSLVAASIDFPYSNQELMDREYLELHNPIEFVPFKFADPDTGQIIETISMAPFIPVTRDSSVIVKTASIMTITNLHSTAERRYLDFIDQLEKRAMQQGLHESEEVFDDDDIPEEVLDLFDDMDISKVH